jgi:hypothetical protein
MFARKQAVSVPFIQNPVNFVEFSQMEKHQNNDIFLYNIWVSNGSGIDKQTFMDGKIEGMRPNCLL